MFRPAFEYCLKSGVRVKRPTPKPLGVPVVAGPNVSVVVLSWNEEENIGRCLKSLARQTRHDFEVLLLDAASTDRTVEKARGLVDDFPVPLRIVTHDHRIPVGEARNQAAQMAKAPIVAYLSADAEADEAWVDRILEHSETADIVYGRQVHEPDRWTFGAAVRGLRYHFPREVPPDALPYASNVAAAYQRDLLLNQPFHPTTYLDDVLAATQARETDHRIVYDPEMVVYHHDVDTWRDELRKNLREARSWGLHRAEIGLHVPLLFWAAMLGLAIGILAVLPNVFTLVAALVVLWLPALRRAIRRRRDMPARALVKGVAASPFFDLAFLANYLRGLLTRRGARPYTTRTPERQT